MAAEGDPELRTSFGFNHTAPTKGVSFQSPVLGSGEKVLILCSQLPSQANTSLSFLGFLLGVYWSSHMFLSPFLPIATPFSFLQSFGKKGQDFCFLCIVSLC